MAQDRKTYDLMQAVIFRQAEGVGLPVMSDTELLAVSTELRSIAEAVLKHVSEGIPTRSQPTDIRPDELTAAYAVLAAENPGFVAGHA